MVTVDASRKKRFGLRFHIHMHKKYDPEKFHVASFALFFVDALRQRSRPGDHICSQVKVASCASLVEPNKVHVSPGFFFCECERTKLPQTVRWTNRPLQSRYIKICERLYVSGLSFYNSFVSAAYFSQLTSTSSIFVFCFFAADVRIRRSPNSKAIKTNCACVRVWGDRELFFMIETLGN